MENNRFMKILNQQKVVLEAVFTCKEVKNIVWAYANYKEPGPDGFTFSFIKRCWYKIGEDICMAIWYFAEHSVLNPGSNASFVTLITKCNDPLNISDFHPINLIMSVRKIISKFRTERIKKIMPSIISKEQ